MSFEIGHSYKGTNGLTYTLLSLDKDFGIFKFNNITKRLRIMNYGGIEAAVQYGEILFKSDKIKVVFDAEFDTPKEVVILKLNNKGERYINVFKAHKEASTIKN